MRRLWLRGAVLTLLGAIALICISLPFGVEGAPTPGIWYYAAIAAILTAVAARAYLLVRRSGRSARRAVAIAAVAAVAPYALVVLIVSLFVSV